MSWQFWVLPLVLFWFFGMRRRMRSPGSGRSSARRFATDPELLHEVESQRSYITELESRVAELENRLDFTERLLTGREGEAASVTSR